MSAREYILSKEYVSIPTIEEYITEYHKKSDRFNLFCDWWVKHCVVFEPNFINSRLVVSGLPARCISVSINFNSGVFRLTIAPEEQGEDVGGGPGRFKEITF